MKKVRYEEMTLYFNNFRYIVKDRHDERIKRTSYYTEAEGRFIKACPNFTLGRIDFIR